MRRPLVSILVVAAALGICIPAVSAQPTLNEVVEVVESDGFYVEPGAEGDPNTISDVVDSSDGLVVVVLAEDDPDGAEFAAQQVADAASGDQVVLVITPGEVGWEGGELGLGADQLSDAGDALLDTFDAGGTVAESAQAFGVVLGLSEPGDSQSLPPSAPQTPTSQATAQENASSGSGGGAGGLLVFLLIVAALIGGLVWFAKRKAKSVDASEVAAAKSEIRAQLEVVAHDIVEHEAAVDLADNPEATKHYRDASRAYNEVSEAVEGTNNLVELADLNDQIDQARWQLEAAEALIEGRPVPPEPEPDKPAACFFDPTHKPGVEAATIKTSAGEKEVNVCQRCADKLERGERPDPRMIEVGGKRVPAAKAPRSHGGLGMGGLSIFEVILGGLGALAASKQRTQRQGSPAPSRRASSAGVDLDWGDMLPKRRKSSAGIGSDRLPSRPRGLPRTSMSRSSTSGSAKRRSSSRGSTSGSRQR